MRFPCHVSLGQLQMSYSVPPPWKPPLRIEKAKGHMACCFPVLCRWVNDQSKGPSGRVKPWMPVHWQGGVQAEIARTRKEARSHLLQDPPVSTSKLGGLCPRGGALHRQAEVRDDLCAADHGDEVSAGGPLQVLPLDHHRIPPRVPRPHAAPALLLRGWRGDQPVEGNITRHACTMMTCNRYLCTNGVFSADWGSTCKKVYVQLSQQIARCQEEWTLMPTTTVAIEQRTCEPDACLMKNSRICQK